MIKSNLKMTQSSSANVSPPTLLATSSAIRVHRRLKSASAESDLRSLPGEFAWCVAPNLLISFKYAWAGIRYAFLTQRNFRIHTGITAVAIAGGIGLRVSGVAMAIVSLTCALVMVLELLNTALESVVDLTVGQSYHELARIAKDCAAGAVMLAAIAALLVASFILLPPLLAFLVSV